MNDQPKNKNIETYVNDMTKILESNKGGLIKELIQEQERREDEKIKNSPEDKKNKFFVVLGSALLLIALSFLGYALIKKKDAGRVEVSSQFKPIIFTDEATFTEIGKSTKDEIATTVLAEMNTLKLTAGEVGAIYLTENKKIIGLRRFLSLIGASFVTRDEVYVSDNFMLGATFKNERDIFFLFKVRSFADIFPVMRDWEKKILYDLAGFFRIDLTIDTNYLTSQEFEDGIISNKNARILYDKDGNIIMLYVFADENSVIITSTEDSAREVMRRLTSGEIKR